MKQKWIGVLLLVLSMMLAGCSSGVSEEEYNALLSENEALKQQLAQYEGTNYDEEASITAGANYEYSPGDAPADEADFLYVNNGTEVQINGYQGDGGYVVIPDEIEGIPVTRIATGAFEDVKSITGIVLPEKLQYIGDSAFYWAENLTGILVIPETVTEIEGHAFQVTNLTGLVIQSDCEIGINAFANIDALEFMYVKEGTSPKIGTAVFGYAEKFTTAVFPASMTEIKDETFDACNALTIYTPSGSFAEEYANRNFIKVDTAGYKDQVSQFENIYG